jgi:predicted nuclease with TOPRIM domain
MTDQPTPETDDFRPCPLTPSDWPAFARAMEIQRNAARAERDAAKRNVAKTATEKIIAASGTELLARIEELESANAAGSAGFESLRAEWESLKTERDALRADVVRLRDVLQRIVSNGGSATNVMLFDARTALAK